MPAIAEKPIKLIKVTVIPRAIPGAASTNSTFLMISEVLAPVAKAASITPESTSFREISISLAKNTVAVIDKGTDAATGPIFVPTKKKVNGKVNTTKIINGTDLIKLITAAITLFKTGFWKKALFAVRYSKKPKMQPNTRENTN